MLDELVPVAAFRSSAEARSALQLLERSGIQAVLTGENAIREGSRSSKPGVELRVKEEDAEAAVLILDQLESESQEEESPEQPERRLHDDLVTVARFDSPIEAHLALSKLLDAGIQATLADAELVAMDWAMSNAIGGIKLQVLRSDLLAAERALDDHPEDVREAPTLRRASARPEAIRPAPARTITRELPPDLQPDDEVPANLREQMILRAARGAILGLIFPPLQFYVVWVLLDVAGLAMEIRREYRWRLVLALVLSVPMVLGMVLLLLMMFRIAS